MGGWVRYSERLSDDGAVRSLMLLALKLIPMVAKTVNDERCAKDRTQWAGVHGYKLFPQQTGWGLSHAAFFSWICYFAKVKVHGSTTAHEETKY